MVRVQVRIRVKLRIRVWVRVRVRVRVRVPRARLDREDRSDPEPRHHLLRTMGRYGRGEPLACDACLRAVRAAGRCSVRAQRAGAAGVCGGGHLCALLIGPALALPRQAGQRRRKHAGLGARLCQCGSCSAGRAGSPIHRSPQLGQPRAHRSVRVAACGPERRVDSEEEAHVLRTDAGAPHAEERGLRLRLRLAAAACGCWLAVARCAGDRVWLRRR